MKRTCFVMVCILLTGTLLFGGSAVFKAMESELSRAMESIEIEGMDAPYFLSLRMTTSRHSRVSAAMGSIYEDDAAVDRILQVMIRVGSPELDNSNFAEDRNTGGMVFGFARSELPLEDDPLVLRQAIWLAIDTAYKSSLEQLSKKRGYMEKHPQEEYPVDFLPAGEPQTFILEEKEDPFSHESLKNKVVQLSRVLRAHNDLTQGGVSITAESSRQEYLDSEGRRHSRPESYIEVNAWMETYTEDHYPVTNQVAWTVTRQEDLPKIEEMTEKITEAAEYLESIRGIKPAEEYNGPVILSGEAAARLFLDVLGKGVSRPRELLSSQEDSFWRIFAMMGGEEGGLARRFNRRVLPATFEVWDRPTLKEWEGHPLLGNMIVDDEGVAAKDIHVVEKGKLTALPMSRTATKKCAEINGHARGWPRQMPAGRVTTLLVEDTDALDEEEFLEEAKLLAEDMGLKEVLLVTRITSAAGIQDPGAFFAMIQSGQSSVLKAPAVAYLLDVTKGEKKPVWGLEFHNVTERVLRDIVASTEHRGLFQERSLFGEGRLPVSVVVPDVLLEEIMLTRSKLEKHRAPDLPMPEVSP